MSINVDSPNDDISTSASAPPTLGGQAPLVADNATVTASSSGNIARWVMDTSAGSTGAEDGANTWAKIGTFTLGTQNNNLASISLSISSSNVSTDICLVDIIIYQSGGTGLNVAAGAGVEIKSISHQYGMLSYNSFKLTQTAATNGSPVDLWVNKKLNFGKLKVTELASNFIDANSYITYNNNAAWQSAVPSGAVNITSDWSGGGPLTSTSLSNSTGTVYYEKSDDGFVTVDFDLSTLTTTTDATTYFTMPSGYRHGISGLALDSTLSGVIAGGAAGSLRMSDVGVVAIYNYAASTGNWRASFRYRARA